MNFHFHLVFVTKVAAMFGFLSKETAPCPLKQEIEGGHFSHRLLCPVLFFCRLTRFYNNKIRLEFSS